MVIDHSIHSFSLWHHFRHVPGFDALAFVDLAESLGFTGINLSLNDENFRHMGGREAWRMDKLRQRLARSAMSLEIDTSDTRPEHMTTLLRVAQRLGAGTLRTYTRHRGHASEMMEMTAIDLRQVAPIAADCEVIVVLENHEDFTGPELAQIVEEVNHPNVKILYDYGNSQMVMEDPEAALDAVLPYVVSVHVKDHVMVRPEHAGQLTVVGVPMGEGFLPVRELTRRLLAYGIRRITFENVWAYTAAIQPGRSALGKVRLGEGAFRFVEPPFRPERLVLDQRHFSPAELVQLERLALGRGLEWFLGELRALGVSGFKASGS
jgi:sugar phosphate isomerase/epimerase